jgi:hypothetical protein
MLDELVAFLRDVRRLVPANGAQRSQPPRGQDVLFAGIRQTPEVSIRRLEFAAQARVMGQPAELRGVMTGWSTAPLVASQPILIRIVGSGSVPMQLRATIDRSGGRVCEELVVDCPDIQLNPQSLGRAEQLRLLVTPSSASLSANIRVEGDELQGDVQLVQKDARITPDRSTEFGGKSFETALAASLASQKSVATRVSLGGTLEKPSCTLSSDLGSVVADAIRLAAEKVEQEHARAVLAAARKRVDERLATLDRQISEEQAKFRARIAPSPERLNAIARSQTRRERLDGRQIGRRLPANSILR